MNFTFWPSDRKVEMNPSHASTYGDSNTPSTPDLRDHPEEIVFMSPPLPMPNQESFLYNRIVKPASEDVNSTLSDREKTHGDFIQNGIIMQDLKDRMVNSVNWQHLLPHEKEALQMIQHKIGRILTGNSSEPDHWKDIAGYAMLVHNILVYGKSHVNA